MLEIHTLVQICILWKTSWRCDLLKVKGSIWFVGKDTRAIYPEADTNEPIENLAGSEDYIARFHKEQDKNNEIAAEEMKRKRKEQRDAKTAASLRQIEVQEAEKANHDAKVQAKKGDKRYSRWWGPKEKRIFEHSIDPQYVKCMVVTTEGTEEEEECLCGDLIS
jgi:hypothetical protein